MLEQSAGVEIGLLTEAQAEVLAAQDQAVRMQIRRLLGEVAALLRGADMDRQSGRNHRRDIILERKQVGQVAVVTVRPDHAIVHRLGELDPETKLVSGTLQTAGHEIADPELVSDLGGRYISILEQKGRMPCNYQEIAEAGQVGDKIARDAIA